MVKTKSRTEILHNKVVSDLEKLLNIFGIKSLKHIQWTKKETGGEIDLIALFPCGNFIYWEVKLRETETGRKQAQNQYNRFLKKYDLTKEEFPGYLCFGNLHAYEL